jgi:hypothetical protein
VVGHDDVVKLPEAILALRDLGLDIRAMMTWRSSTKIIPALQASS